LKSKNPIIIIGQGISGTMLSWYLYNASVPFKVVDAFKENTPSKVAAGIINPVTGRRIVKTWMIDQIMPYAVQAYQDFGKQFNINVVAQKSIVDCFATQQMKDAFTERVAENADYLSINNSINVNNQVNCQLGYGNIEPCYIVNLKKMLSTWRNFLQSKKLLIEKTFDQNEVVINGDDLSWKNMEVSKIIFADGANGENNIWFKNLPFAPNKGEALIIEAKNLDKNFIYKKGLTIAPLGNHRFWVGANYIWKYNDELPTTQFYNDTNNWLTSFLKTDFTVIQHIAAIRPANVERRPFVGLHPLYKNIGILNGMGAKATSLAPFFANELVQHLLYNTPLHPEANVQRFAKVLVRS
jgi:glycine/D-amino acid oxidase-like deaminating enzyme